MAATVNYSIYTKFSIYCIKANDTIYKSGKFVATQHEQNAFNDYR